MSEMTSSRDPVIKYLKKSQQRMSYEILLTVLKNLLFSIGNVTEDLMLTFEVFVGEYGKITSKELVPNGSDVSVTNDNREEFVRLYLDWLLNSSIDERFRAFYLGM